MKHFIFSLVLLLGSSSFAAIKVEYRINRLHGLFDFVMTISGDPHHAPGVKKYFDDSKFNNLESQNFLTTLETIKPSLRRTIDFQLGMPDRQGGSSVEDLITTQSLFAKDLNDLSQRTLGLLPMNDHLLLFSTLKFFEPIYNELLWKRSIHDLKNHKKKLDRLAREVQLDQMFLKAQIFYRANWPPETGFVVGLYPVPLIKDFKNSTNSHSLGSIEEHGVLIGAKNSDIEGSFGVVFHELCHSLYETQSKEFMKEFENYFLQNPSMYRAQAYTWINETLATALGNGWAAERANKGQNDDKSWYNHPTIEGFAREIYPMAKSYLEAKKPMDREFIDKAIDLFAKRFPDSIYSFENIFNQVVFVHNSTVLHGPSSGHLLRKSFFVSGYEGSSPFENEETFKTVQDASSTVVLVFKGDDLGALQKLTSHNAFLLNHLKNFSQMTPRSYFAALDEKSRAYVVVRAESAEDWAQAIEALKKAGKFNPQELIYRY